MDNQSDSESSTCTEDTRSSVACSESSDDSFCGSDESESSTDRVGEDDSETLPQHQDNYAANVRLWAEKVPIGLGLCPWAMKSKRDGRLKYSTCEGNLPSDVAALIISEAKALRNTPSLTTTLVVCPHVTEWETDFQLFDDFVKNTSRAWNEQLFIKEDETGENPHCHFDLREEVTLVAFHPNFLRWYGLPTGLKIGSVVQSHRCVGLSQKTQETYSATIIETGNKVFGLRKVKVRFHDDMKEQYVPTNWFVTPQQCSAVKGNDGGGVLVGGPLPDNEMHRAPYPTVHLIKNEDLGKMCIRDISRVKRKNAQRMMKLGWKGVLRQVAF